MIHFEANLDGSVEPGEAYTNFNEATKIFEMFSDLGWKPALRNSGRGGYFLFEVRIESVIYRIHLYLKKVTFGGRDNRQYEKRAQFSAGLDRAGFEIGQEKQNEFALIIGIYKREKFPNIVLCAWDIEDWGRNVGRAFNCFVDVHKIAEAYEKKISQHRTSIGQIVCCFVPEKFKFYIDNRSELHKNLLPNFDNLFFEDLQPGQSGIPKYQDLYQYVIDTLKKLDGSASIDIMEEEIAVELGLSDEEKQMPHNPNEGSRTKLGYQLAWARNYLKRAGLIENPKRTIWALTQLGWNIQTIDKIEISQTVSQAEIQNEIERDSLFTVKSEDDIEIEDEPINLTIENPFDPNLVDIRTRTMSLDLLIKRLENDEIDMNTSFQRKANLWNKTKQSRLIESILVKFPLPAFYFDGSNDDKWLVVDGLQRLSAIHNYVNKQAFGLENPEFLGQFRDLKFRELPSYLQRRIQEFEVTAYVIAAGTPKVLKYNVFKRINTGGLTLTSQEIRNALNQGKASKFVKKLAEMRAFKMATDYSIPEDRMLDQEFVTRFLAFYLFDTDVYNSDLDGFLNKTMEYLNTLDDEEQNKIQSDFNKGLLASHKIFGRDAFRKRFSRRDKRKPINKALFEVWSVSLSKQDAQQIDFLVQNKETLIDIFIARLKNDEEFNKSISSSTGDKSRVKRRFAEVESIIASTLITL
ncbi:hypothetical protein FNO01nite_05050 [Flavobacterium noncentrifugens]|uniref:DUF262 domain-containing protein n=1 Tax=Flavobacterium noncentrifugens TaxID=1128970 RepID=A0A1G8SHN5_9FLAO|nr:DUF262 domain-containing protein [Flavobacterium noncentrifugens]GEP49833.1 hypothetical protein FNO01nite_05050 [Flavobacterium noncentrifugens]SDJ28663.1 Protein of unknown function DUF262 [Flavobacterium noncentrifugens]